jgi:hypothetical protein
MVFSGENLVHHAPRFDLDQADLFEKFPCIHGFRSSVTKQAVRYGT